MEIAVVNDAISSIAYSTTQSLTFSNLILNRPYNILSVTDAASDQLFRVSAASPPPTRTLTKRRLRRKPRVKRKIGIDDNSNGDGGESGFLGFGGDGGDLGSGGGGGKGWSFGGYGGANWGDFKEDNSISDPAFDFVYEVLCWIAMSNCLHFAFKKVVRLVSDGYGDREKVPVC